MAFWQSSELEPKRSFKFTLSISGKEGKIPQFLIKKVNKPSFTVSESEHKFLNHSFWFPGKVTWNEVSFTIVDVLGEADGAKALVDLFVASGYTHPGDIGKTEMATESLKTISKFKSTQALGKVMINQLDSGGGAPSDKSAKPDPTIRETWVLNNAWIKDVKFGDLDYDSEDMLNVEVSLKYDNACLFSDGESIMGEVAKGLISSGK